VLVWICSTLSQAQPTQTLELVDRLADRGHRRSLNANLEMSVGR